MNGFSGSTLSMQNAKLRCCVQTTDREGLSFSDFLDQRSLKVVTAQFDMSEKSGKEHFESKNVQIFVMKCVSEMQFMQLFCYLTV